MRTRPRRLQAPHLSSIAVGLLLLLLLPAPAYADATSPALPQTSSGHVTVIVLDMSGSMSDNDPDGLRCSAANAYIDLSGPGDFIGVVGLDDGGQSGGPNGYGSAQIWAQPAEMATVADRQNLRSAIATKSHNCRPDASTPTYDALSQALTMLGKAATNGRSGSVILLTDGAPMPNSDGQINSIKTILVPQFKQRGFPVDTIALGGDQSFHGFLDDLANGTSGKAYDDGKGAVSGVSPLNIAPFFVDIFARYSGRVVSQDIAPTQLSGGAVSRNFAVGDFVSHLDVIVVKDSPDARVTLTAPNGQTLPPAVGGTFISTDPHYAIFAIDHPQTGAWQVNVAGPGQFLMDSLKVSTLGLTITAPDAGHPTLPIGQPLTITATLNDGGTQITGSRFSLTGAITYGGAGAQYRQEFVLDDKASPGAYSTTITIPEAAPTGSYVISVTVREVSDTVASADHAVRIERFPVPSFLTAAGTPTTNTVPASEIRWDPVLNAVYSVPVGFVNWLSNFALQGHPAGSRASAAGRVYLDGQPYTSATVTGHASRQGSTASVPITIANDGGGRFRVDFPASAPGTYTVTLDTQGAYADTHGDFGTVARTVTVTITQATLLQEIIAWLYTIAYLLIFAAIINLIRTLAFTPAPYGTWERSSSRDGRTARAQSFSRTLRSPWNWFMHRNVLSSKQALRTSGLTFRFKRGGLIEVKREGRAGDRWSSTSGRLTDEYSAAKVLTYRPTGGESGLDGDSDSVTYTINASPKGGGTTRAKATSNKVGTRTLGANPAAKRGASRGGRGGKVGARAGSRGGGDSLFGGI